MNQKIISVALLVLTVVGGLIFVRFLTPEDDWICVDGRWARHGNPSAPMPDEQCPGAENVKKEVNITVDSPKAAETVGRHLIIKGSARVFENQFNWKVLDADKGIELKSGTAYANAADAGLFGLFEIETILPEADTAKIIFQAFDYSAKDGSVQDLVEVPLNFDNKLNDAYEVYFSNNNLDPQITCVRVFPVIRPAGAGALNIKSALEILLQGPSAGEKEAGYFTNIPENVKVKSVQKTGNAVKVDFSSDIEKGMGGSCRVGAVRSQIYWTVINFDKTARSVIISVEGEAETALQP